MSLRSLDRRHLPAPWWGMMKRIGRIFCVLLLVLPSMTAFGGEEDAQRAEAVRTGITIAGTAAGLAAGATIGIAFSLDAIDTPLSNALLLTVPVAAAGAATGTLVGRCIADIVLRNPPSPLFAVLEGAGLGLVGGAVIGAVTFTLNFAIAYPLLDVPEGYWGRFDVPQAAGMAVLAGGFWGGFFGMIAGAIALPVVAWMMDD